eukprot:TRINITY_DN5003_c0_g1_i1.p1 TRINITY_DN5003_c0_g1~~TRINITY_DN5003_c0_g1_i1.p1  ORF type:complete len:446 (-),score=104.94 TRINITY_DN5003_c0_g1_i1:104-1441(-)
MKFLSFLFSLSLFVFVCSRYTPDWDSLDSRPLPSWYDEAKFGIFIHWGVYSVPATKPEAWYWWDLDGIHDPTTVAFHKREYGDKKYADLAPSLKASFFDPDQWAKVFQRSGAKYVVFTSKHHEGFCNWRSAESWNWNSVDTGPKLDVIGALSASLKKFNLTFGLYYSLYEWFNPIYLQDKQNKTNRYVTEVMLPQLYDIVNQYHPQVIWSDGDWEQPDDYWQSKKFLSWLYNDSPVKDTVVTNDRWGAGDMCKHGGFYTCADRYDPGVLQPHKWEDAFTIDRTSFGYNRNSSLSGYLTIEEIVKQFVITISCGGNVLLDVGPTADGLILPIFEERLLQLGKWLEVNGKAIYSSVPWKKQNETEDLWYTSSKDKQKVFAIFFHWPSDGEIQLKFPIPSPSTSIQLLGYGPVDFKHDGRSLTISLPLWSPTLIPVEWAWVLEMQDVS